MSRRKETFNSRVILVKDNDDLNIICDLINKNYEVIVNVSSLDIKKKYRVIDFLSGYSMGIGGNRIKLENNIYSFRKNKVKE